MKNFCYFLFSLQLIIELVVSTQLLEWKELREGVLLKWVITTIPDYIEIYRREKNTDTWDKIKELNSTIKEYKDTQIRVTYEYYYKVKFITNNIIKVSNIIIGYRTKTATVEGTVYWGHVVPVRYAPMIISSDYYGYGTKYYTSTDDNGHFIMSLPYNGKREMYYYVSVDSKFSHSSCQGGSTATVFFDLDHNYQKCKICINR